MSFVYILVFLLIAFSVHEFFHAWVADKLGDPTPRFHGRVTLNPLAHVDLVGFLALLIFRVGWGKPVPVNVNNFKNIRRDTLLVSLAGPFSNLILALWGVFIARQYIIFLPFAIVNLNLGLFNLLPIYPLDGYKAVESLLPTNFFIWWKNWERYGFYFLILGFLPLMPGGNSLIFLGLRQVLDFFLKVFYI